MNKICILTLYFGKLPNYFQMWLESCSHNPNFDFIIITDQIIQGNPPNVKIIQGSLSKVKERFDSCTKLDVALDKPYKLCDYRPIYGEAFSDLLYGYDFWGHCDVDVIWGDLKAFIPAQVLQKYDKIFSYGHLSLYRNTSYINSAYKLPGSRRGDYKQVISTNKSCVFDEIYGIVKIFENNNIPIYQKETAADICFLNQRMVIAGNQNINYPYQIFTYERGHCYRYFLKHGNLARDEFSYIHLQKRTYNNSLSTDCYLIGQNEFIPFDGNVTIEMIKKYNPYKGKIFEWCEYKYRDLKFRITRKIKNLFID